MTISLHCFACNLPSSQYHEDSVSGNLLCPPCFVQTKDIDLLIQKTLAKICIRCDTTEASQWYKYKAGQYKCGRCYNIARRDLALSGNSGIICAGCQTTKTSKWYACREGVNQGQKNCKNCHIPDIALSKAPPTSLTSSSENSSEKRSFSSIDSVASENPPEKKQSLHVANTNEIDLVTEQTLVKTIAGYPSTKPRKWYTYKEEGSKGRDKYNKCRNAVRKALDKICAGCQSTKTTQWYTYKEGVNQGKNKCKKCYDELHTALPKARSTSFTSSSKNSFEKRSLRSIDSVAAENP